MAERPTGTVTFLFTDVEGSTRFWEERPQEMGVALERHDEILRTAIAAHDGYVFSTAGDAFAAAFARAGDGVMAATAAQRALGLEAWPANASVNVRMGLHTGEAQERDGDYFGPGLNRTARLMSVAHGGQIVLSAVTARVLDEAASTTVEVVDLGEHRLQDLAGREHVFQVVGAGLASTFPPLRSLRDDRGILPVQFTGFHGRTAELDQLAKLLASERLVTVTGPGGIGKTRLALQAAATMRDSRSGGLWFCDLAPLGEGSAVAHVVASTLGVSEQTGRPISESLCGWVADQELLLILDNCEQVSDAVADLIAMMLSRCPALKVLATSRVAIGVVGEQRFPLSELNEPADAVALFADRARLANPNFAPGAHQAVVAEICEHLAGIPLAIELAAARTRSLTPDAVLERIIEHPALLADRSRDRPERHRTLAAAIEWSIADLDAEAALLLARLSVFVGGFTLRAAEAIAAFEPLDPIEVFDLVDSLVEASLVQLVDQQVGGTRYRMLEPIRQQIAAGLSDTEAEAISASHASWYAERAHVLQEGLLSVDEARSAAEIYDELANLRKAHRWCLDHRPALAARLVTGLSHFSISRASVEIADWFDLTLAELDPDEDAYHETLAGAVHAWYLQKRLDEVIQAGDQIDAERVSPLLRCHGGWMIATTHYLVDDHGTMFFGRGGDTGRFDAVEADAALSGAHLVHVLALGRRGAVDEALQIADASRNPTAIAWANFHAGLRAAETGDASSALQHLDLAIAIARQVDSWFILAASLAEWAIVSHDQDGHSAPARAAVVESLEILQRAGAANADAIRERTHHILAVKPTP